MNVEYIMLFVSLCQASIFEIVITTLLLLLLSNTYFYFIFIYAPHEI